MSFKVTETFFSPFPLEVTFPEIVTCACIRAVSYTHLTLPTTVALCRSRWSPDQ
nr:hypothetical protein [Elizabethkingia sp. ASV34]